jgi:hypothetical protein
MSICLDGSEDASIRKVCQEADMLLKGLAVGANIVAWLPEICDSFQVQNDSPFTNRRVSGGWCDRIQVLKAAGR